MDPPQRQGIACARFSTKSIRPDRRDRAWSQLIAALAVMRPATVADRPLEATLVSYNLGSMMLARCHSSAAHYVRDQKVIQRSLLDNHVLLQLLLSGNGLARFEGAPTELHRGDICLIDLKHPAELRFNRDCEHIDVLIPRDALNGTQRALHGRVLREGQSLCRMLSEHLLQLFDMLPSLGVTHVDTMARATLAVLRICLDDRADPEHPQLNHSDALLARILVYIDAHLGNVELGSRMLQRDFRLSRATLYRMFTEHGGVTHCIREKRLTGAHHDLRSRPHQQISEVVFRWGFSCERQFQRAFRARFGMTPSAVRRQGEHAKHGAPRGGTPSSRFDGAAPVPGAS